MTVHHLDHIAADEAHTAVLATRQMANAANAALREQLLAALGESDDGRTPLSGYVAALVAHRDQLRAAVRRYAKSGAEAICATNRVRDTIARLGPGLATIHAELLLNALDGQEHAHTYGMPCPARACRWPLDPAAERDDAEFARWIARAAQNPGSIAGRRRGPSWGEGAEGYAEEQETVSEWVQRAVLAILAKNGRPHCERCCEVIRVDDVYDPPLPGVGLWEHKGVCPVDAKKAS